MGSSDRTCVKCKKAIKSTEIDLVCGLWCRKSFHNECLGLSNSEARAATCSKVRFKFHCEACEERLGFELFGDRETHEPKSLENCVNNCTNLLELVQKLVKLTNELSNDNVTLHSKLDTVLNSTARLEEYLLPSPKRFENVSEETFADNVEYVTDNSTKRMTETREPYEYTTSNNRSVNNKQRRCESEFQQTDISLQHIASDFPEHSRHQENTAEGCSSNEWEMPDGHASTYDPTSIEKERLQEWEEPGGHNSTHGALSIVKQECAPSEDFLMSNTFSTEETENEEDEENAVIEDAGEKLSSSEDFLRPSTLVIKKTENEEDDEVVVMEDDFEELQHEVESTAGGEPESSIPVGVEDDKINDDSSGLVTTVCVDRPEVLHSCNICQKTFTTRGSLKRHYVVHTGERSCNCSAYNKSFEQNSELKVHLRLHSGEYPYSCSICNKTFNQQIHLRQHSQYHSGERPYTCDVCNKGFVRRHVLNRHMLLHTGERPFMCDVCNKTFKQAADLRRHSQVHTGERPYRCGVCNYTFKRSDQLKRHSQLHTGECPRVVKCVIRDSGASAT